jgi:hypothetical protein
MCHECRLRALMMYYREITGSYPSKSYPLLRYYMVYCHPWWISFQAPSNWVLLSPAMHLNLKALDPSQISYQQKCVSQGCSP